MKASKWLPIWSSKERPTHHEMFAPSAGEGAYTIACPEHGRRFMKGFLRTAQKMQARLDPSFVAHVREIFPELLP